MLLFPNMDEADDEDWDWLDTGVKEPTSSSFGVVVEYEKEAVESCGA